MPKEKKCDGYHDCRDKSDEKGCAGVSCDLQEFRCENGEKCIAKYQKCNHRNECEDGSDEKGCSEFPSYRFAKIMQIKSNYFFQTSPRATAGSSAARTTSASPFGGAATATRTAPTAPTR